MDIERQIFIWYSLIKPPGKLLLCRNNWQFILWWFYIWSNMKFSNCEDRLKWLKDTSQKLRQMEQDRMRAILDADYAKAFSLLKGIKFARSEFAKVSNQIWKERKCKR